MYIYVKTNELHFCFYLVRIVITKKVLCILKILTPLKSYVMSEYQRLHFLFHEDVIARNS